jgi:hypothetical protein
MGVSKGPFWWIGKLDDVVFCRIQPRFAFPITSDQLSRLYDTPNKRKFNVDDIDAIGRAQM